jgi:hypothetical protein
VPKREAAADHPLAAWSGLVFKSGWLLPVAAAIRECSDGTFTQTQLATRFGVSSSAIKGTLDKFRDGALIKDGHWVDGRQELHVIDPNHPFWLFVDGLMRSR